MDTRLLLAAQLRSAADGLAANPVAYERYNLHEQAGAIIAEAYRRGYLHVDGLGPLVERFEGPTPPGPNGAYSNMLLCIVGSHIFHADRVGDSLRTTGVEAGIIDGVLPVDPLRDRDGVVWDGQVVIVLRALADEVEGKPEATGGKPTAALEPEAPIPLLLSWREITDALGRPNTAEFRESLKRLNDQHDGPLVVPGRGAQPKVNREKLIAWWNSLEARLAELDARKRDKVETVNNQYRYGADGEVVPDISGGVKRRRGGST